MNRLSAKLWVKRTYYVCEIVFPRAPTASTAATKRLSKERECTCYDQLVWNMSCYFVEEFDRDPLVLRRE